MSSDYQQRRVSAAVAPAPANHNAQYSLHNFTPDGRIPNHPQLPVMFWRGLVSRHASDDAIKAMFEHNGWRRVWTWKVFDYQHFHPNAHEVLCVAEGSAQIQLGGSSGPIVDVRAGDAAVLPAGTGHCSIEASSDFAICGGYPPNQVDRVITEEGEMSLADAQRAVAKVSLPNTDPFFGQDGPLISVWQTATQGS